MFIAGNTRSRLDRLLEGQYREKDNAPYPFQSAAQLFDFWARTTRSASAWQSGTGSGGSYGHRQE
jgi:hypothetical protein